MQGCGLRRGFVEPDRSKYMLDMYSCIVACMYHVCMYVFMRISLSLYVYMYVCTGECVDV